MRCLPARPPAASGADNCLAEPIAQQAAHIAQGRNGAEYLNRQAAGPGEAANVARIIAEIFADEFQPGHLALELPRVLDAPMQRCAGCPDHAVAPDQPQAKTAVPVEHDLAAPDMGGETLEQPGHVVRSEIREQTLGDDQCWP